MNGFQVTTRGASSPQGKPRVYFSAHPEDDTVYFESISQEILDKQNCAVYTLKHGEIEAEDYELYLAEMQLFVVPVTKRLLTSYSRTMDVDVPFALKHHTPVLPLMQEGGLDALFTQKFGDLQYLDKNAIDPTAISYDEKLTHFLESVIVGDELAQKVRAAFDAYIFLSYRKKDRKYARQLMTLIHADPLCRDFAIWYDEFLTPGEDFNDAIRQALTKSDLFALAVTPNLINEMNYVLSTEYPMARELGKEIFPAELCPTDINRLKEMYTGIPDPIRVEDTQKLTERLQDLVHKLAITPSANEPQHNYYIGLAYLSGIDVEVNHERAVELITSSAKSGFAEANKKLVNMYSVGDGVEKNIQAAIQWQKRLVDLLIDIAEETYSEEDALAVLREQMALGEMAFNAEDFELAEKSFSTSYNIAKVLSFGAIGKTVFGKMKVLFKKYVMKQSCYEEAIIYLARASRMMLEIAFALGVAEHIEEWSQKALVIIKAANQQQANAKTAVEMIALSAKMAKECAQSGNLSATEYWIRICRESWEPLDETERTLEVRFVYSFIYDAHTEYEMAIGRYNRAYDAQDDRKKLLINLLEEYPESRQVCDEIIRCLLTEADICIRCSDLKSAQELSDNAQKLIDLQVSQGDDKAAQLNAHNLLQKGKIAYAWEDYESAVELLSQSYQILLTITQTKFDADHQRQLAAVAEILGDCFYVTGRYADAAEWHKTAVDTTAGVIAFAKLVKDSRTTAVLYEKLLDDAIALHKGYYITEYYEKALWTRKALVEGTRIKSGFKSADVSELVKTRQIKSPHYIKDKQALDRLSERKDEILRISKKAPVPINRLKNRMHPAKADTSVIISGIKELMYPFLQAHTVVEIRSDLQYLEYVLGKINRLSDLFDNGELSIVKVIRSAGHVQSYILKNLSPFFKYDEEGLLILSFCSYLYNNLSVKTNNGRENAIEEFDRIFTHFVFWDYPVSEIKHPELWQHIYCLIVDNHTVN